MNKNQLVQNLLHDKGISAMQITDSALVVLLVRDEDYPKLKSAKGVSVLFRLDSEFPGHSVVVTALCDISPEDVS